MKAAKANSREREGDVYHLYSHLGVTSRTGGVEEGVGDRWGLPNTFPVTILGGPRNFGCFGVLHLQVVCFT